MKAILSTIGKRSVGADQQSSLEAHRDCYARPKGEGVTLKHCGKS
jgi:hypothetical protein